MRVVYSPACVTREKPHRGDRGAVEKYTFPTPLHKRSSIWWEHQQASISTSVPPALHRLLLGSASWRESIAFPSLLGQTNHWKYACYLNAASIIRSGWRRKPAMQYKQWSSSTKIIDHFSQLYRSISSCMYLTCYYAPKGDPQFPVEWRDPAGDCNFWSVRVRDERRRPPLRAGDGKCSCWWKMHCYRTVRGGS